MKRHHVARLSSLPAGGHIDVDINGMEVGLYRIGDEIRAWRNFCPHQGAPVCRGTISGTNLASGVYEYKYGREGEILQCPWHGWEFDLLTGRHLVEQSKATLRGFHVEVEDDNIFVYTRV